MRRISSQRCLVYRARLFDNDRFLVGGALVVIFVRTSEELCHCLNVSSVLDISLRQATLFIEIASQGSGKTLFVVAARRPISVPSSAIGSGVGNRDQLAPAAVTQTTSLEFRAGCLNFTGWRPASKNVKSSRLPATTA